jgi:G3E family GTPase
MTIESIPVTAIIGFLGSGKTTLLNHILQNNHGLKIGVVVNDYGDINIDSELVKDQTDDMLELSNGCLCCSMDSLELDEAINQFALPGSNIDHIVIEASGLAEPADLRNVIRDATGKTTRLDCIVAVVDAVNYNHSAETLKMVRQQVDHSEFVIINKTDLIKPNQIEKIKALILEINPRARILTSVDSQVDVRLLLETKANIRADSQADRNHTGHQHLHDHFSKFSFVCSEPLDPQLFQDFVNIQIPSSIYRAKGIVNLGKMGQNRKYIFQLVGKRADLSWQEWKNQVPKTELVFIGIDIDQPGLQQRLKACVFRQAHGTIKATPLVNVKRSG